MALSNERMSGSGRADRRCTFGAIKDEHLGKDSVSFVMVCTLRSTQPSVSELYLLQIVEVLHHADVNVEMRLTCPCMRTSSLLCVAVDQRHHHIRAQREHVVPGVPAALLGQDVPEEVHRERRRLVRCCHWLLAKHMHTRRPVVHLQTRTAMPQQPHCSCWHTHDAAACTCRWCERCQSVSPPTWRYVLSVTAQVTLPRSRAWGTACPPDP